MLNIFLQAWGGVFYLLNKVFFSRAERSNEITGRKWRIASWSVYLCGLPAWVTILVMEHNWIAASVEGAGAVSMALGLANAVRGTQKEISWLTQAARVAIAVGLAASLWDFGGITTLRQVLELALSVGFLFGTYFLAKQRASGYLCFMLMNASAAGLMGIEHYPWLMLEQIISLGFVADAFITQKRKQAEQ